MQSTPKSNRIHIGIFGKRNAGKSSLLNALTKQQVAIVSEIPGTTTDPVEKTMEFLPLGPCVFVDTAGIDDEGEIGHQRIKKTEEVLCRTDIAIWVSTGNTWDETDKQLLTKITDKKIACIIVFNKCDTFEVAESVKNEVIAKKIPFVIASANTGTGMTEIRSAMVDMVPGDLLSSNPLAADLISENGTAILVIPVDAEAPKGRLILPQAQVIRDLLDHGKRTLIVRESELANALNSLKKPPDLVITDSQAFAEVGRIVPNEIKLTSFSILFARAKGDLEAFVKDTAIIEKLTDGSKILIAESCTHHPIGEDIGRIKIPTWLKNFTKKELNFSHTQGYDFPEDLSKYSLVIQCGGCMHNRKLMLNKQKKCMNAGIPITNYGLTIAYVLGILPRSLEPFPEAHMTYKKYFCK